VRACELAPLFDGVYIKIVSLIQGDARAYFYAAIRKYFNFAVHFVKFFSMGNSQEYELKILPL